MALAAAKRKQLSERGRGGKGVRQKFPRRQWVFMDVLDKRQWVFMDVLDRRQRSQQDNADLH